MGNPRAVMSRSADRCSTLKRTTSLAQEPGALAFGRRLIRTGPHREDEEL